MCYAVSFVSQFTHDPTNEHLKAILKIIRYLKATSSQGLYFKLHVDSDIMIFIDAYWTASRTEIRSTIEYVEQFGDLKEQETNNTGQEQCRRRT